MPEIKTSTLVESLIAFSGLLVIGGLMAAKLIMEINVTYSQTTNF